jgi:hypothetical protein
MHAAQARPMYTGYPGAQPYGGHGHSHGAPGHGFCAGCGHPRSACCCGCRECRKESRELLVEATKRGNVKDALGDRAKLSIVHALADSLGTGDQAGGGEAAASRVVSADALAGAGGAGKAFVGGSCCVHLSVEYTPLGTADGLVGVSVQDTDTELVWLKKVSAGLGYQIKEGVVTTKPGAHLTVVAVGATARVRWCEVFSC